MGSNLFWYFANPCGGATEYFADMDRMDDDWEPRDLGQQPRLCHVGDGLIPDRRQA